MAQKKVKKTGLNLYRVTFYYHTNGCVDVKASSEEEALKLADGGDVPNEELLEGLQEDDSPDAELIEAINRVKNSFNSYPADRLAIAAGIAQPSWSNFSTAYARHAAFRKR